MTPEFYRRINQVADAALTLAPQEREAFLEESCGSNLELRSKVEALLSAYESDDGFLAEPVFETLAKEVASDWKKHSIVTGQVIAHYEVLNCLGFGGSGEVWLARDTQLSREVALKILNPGFSDDAGHVRQLRQEARAASRLNHPNIVTIYEIGEAGGTHFIAQEFVEGGTLRSAIAAKNIRPLEAVKIAAQVAAALEAAGAAHVVHRDVKPENVMIRPDGLVKLVDFGLAFERGDQASRAPMGTAKYMSPEQAQGTGFDARSDLFSLGVMLHEMLAGAPPFTGATISEILTAVVHSDPPPLPESLPCRAELGKIARKCLQKDPQLRYASASELRKDLERVAARMENPRRTALIVVAACATIVAAVAIAIFSTSGNRRAGSFNSMTIARLPARGGVSDVAISPDGARIAYTLAEGDRQGVYLRDLGSHRDIGIVAPESGRHIGLIFSLNGDSVYYVLREADGSEALARIPLRTGAKAEVVLNDVSGPIAFSPDGKQLAFVRLDRFRADASLMIANIDGSGLRTVTTRSSPRYFSRRGLAWSPDGRTIVCMGGEQKFYNSSAFQPIAVRVQDGRETMIGNRGWPWVSAVVWLADGSLLVDASDTVEDLQQIWLISYPSGDVRRVTNDLSDYETLSVTKDGGTLVSIQKDTPINLWLLRPSEPARAVRISQADLRGVDSMAWTPDRRIVFTARSGEYRNIWITDARGSNTQQLTDGRADRSEVAVTRDGRYILYQSQGKIWRMNPDGGGAIQLTHGALDVHPWPSADGKNVIYASFEDWSPEIGGKAALWRVPIDGGEATRISGDDTLSIPRVSPDGKRIVAAYFAGPDPRFASPKLALLPIDGGSPPVVLDPLPGASDQAYWTPDGKALVVKATKASVGNLWQQSLDGTKATKLTDFKSDLILDFAWSPDGSKIAIARGNSSGDVVLIRNFR